MCKRLRTKSIRTEERTNYPVISLEDDPELMDRISLDPDNVLSDIGPRELAGYFVSSCEDEKILILAYVQARLPSYEGQFRRHLKDPLLGLTEDPDF